MDIFLKYVINVCVILRNRSEFRVFNFIFVFSATKLIRNGYCYLRSIWSVKICCSVLWTMTIYVAFVVTCPTEYHTSVYVELFRGQLQGHLVYQTDLFWEHSVSTFPLMKRICVMWTDFPIIFFGWWFFFFREINSLRDSLLFQLDISSVRCLMDGSCSSK